MTERIVLVLGTRPEIVKLSPVINLLGDRAVLVHSGQHYSYSLDRVFFEELGLPEPRHQLAVGSASHGVQVGRLLPGIEAVLRREGATAAVVQGDTNTALAGALAAAKIHVPVVHVEAGCRSGNRRMPEETNRILIDHAADLHLAPNDEAVANLAREGIGPKTTRLVGSTSVDSCRLQHPRAASRLTQLRERLGLHGGYAVATVHRAENTDPAILPGILDALAELSRVLPVALPLHPRTRDAGAATYADVPGLRVIEPLGYLDMLALMGGARMVLSDSGGIQEEAPALGVPVVVMRRETEWGDLLGPRGNLLAGNDGAGILAAAAKVLDRPPPAVDLPQIDARAGAGARIVAAIDDLLAGRVGRAA
ncbi:MAG: UDP-N-acetylglucosamine 2-epimerase (non-hydrolyzing) [Alphaproteobacteria bacterium]|nr:UDP-N-acetylglucosamine 2-epimerase (non-hydrolyzing) [Alphaproteobacteria bacterium]